MGRDDVLAWVESPLQLLGAAEWAAAHGTAVPVACRLTDQIPETATELRRRDALLGAMEPYLGIPWRLLAQHGHWLVGDGFSGQFRLAAAVLRPSRITFLDDGAHVLPFADTVLGRRPYARPHVEERGLTRATAPAALEIVLRRALQGRVSFFTAFDLAERATMLHRWGVEVRRHDFGWTRSTARAGAALGPRVVLGSARPVDGRMSTLDYLRWVRATTIDGPVVYLPHRRETPEQLRAVSEVGMVEVRPTHLPVELVLAGAPDLRDIFTLPSSTLTTLPLVLAGSRARLRTEPPRQRAVGSVR